MHMKTTKSEDDNFQEAEDIQVYAGLVLHSLSVIVCTGGGTQGHVCVRQELFNRSVSLVLFSLKIWPGEVAKPVRARAAKGDSLEPIWWEDRADSSQLSLDHHMNT